MDNKSLSKVRYEEALRLLQSNEPMVQLTISQIATTPIQKTKSKATAMQRKVELYRSEENFRSLELYSILSHGEDEQQPRSLNGGGLAEKTHEAFEDPVLRYFANMKQEQEDRAEERRLMDVSAGNHGSLPRVLSSSASKLSLSFSKSVPDLPKVVAIIPKRVDVRPPALPKCVGLGRRYTGPVRYPVTPAKDPMTGRTTATVTLDGVPNKRQLSLPVNEGRESQVI